MANQVLMRPADALPVQGHGIASIVSAWVFPRLQTPLFALADVVLSANFFRIIEGLREST